MITLQALSTYTRGGIAGLCKRLRNVTALDALEGKLHQHGLDWAGGSWRPPGAELVVLSGGAPPGEPVRMPAYDPAWTDQEYLDWLQRWQPREYAREMSQRQQGVSHGTA